MDNGWQWVVLWICIMVTVVSIVLGIFYMENSKIKFALKNGYERTQNIGNHCDRWVKIK